MVSTKNGQVREPDLAAVPTVAPFAPARLRIESLSSAADARAFKELNEEWISSHFTLEDADRASLDDPQGSIIDPGGDVLLARYDQDVVGSIALIAGEGGLFEIAKMAVAPALRGRGIGRAILNAAVVRAVELGAERLFLGSNTKLADAIHLYEAVGFRHVPADRVGSLPYTRADVFMDLMLEPR
jgi:GNAT superfamily N-acetyltransferase